MRGVDVGLDQLIVSAPENNSLTQTTQLLHSTIKDFFRSQPLTNLPG